MFPHGLSGSDAGVEADLNLLVSYAYLNVRNDNIAYSITSRCYTVSDNHRYVHLGLGTRPLIYPYGGCRHLTRSANRFLKVHI